MIRMPNPYTHRMSDHTHTLSYYIIMTTISTASERSLDLWGPVITVWTVKPHTAIITHTSCGVILAVLTAENMVLAIPAKTSNLPVDFAITVAKHSTITHATHGIWKTESVTSLKNA